MESISDRTNTAAAFAFLREIEDRKQDECTNDEQKRIEFCSSKYKRIPFNKSVTVGNGSRFTDITDEQEEDVNDGPLLKGSKLVMPEYVIGQKVRKERRQKTGASIKIKEIKLDHLMEEEDDDEDDVII